ncbi:unnamed protein product, partial [Symbiodinium necroappetens]
GIPLKETLRCGGRLWRWCPADLPQKEAFQVDLRCRRASTRYFCFIWIRKGIIVAAFQANDAIRHLLVPHMGNVRTMEVPVLVPTAPCPQGEKMENLKAKPASYILYGCGALARPPTLVYGYKRLQVYCIGFNGWSFVLLYLQSTGARVYISLAWGCYARFGWRHVLLTWIIVVFVVEVLTLLDVLPMHFVYEETSINGERLRCPFGGWALYIGVT